MFILILSCPAKIQENVPQNCCPTTCAAFHNLEASGFDSRIYLLRNLPIVSTCNSSLSSHPNGIFLGPLSVPEVMYQVQRTFLGSN